MLQFIGRNFSFKNKDAILLLYVSLVSFHLEYAGQSWLPSYAKNIPTLEAILRGSTKMITSLLNKSFEEELTRLSLFPSWKIDPEVNLLNIQNTQKAYECRRN